MLDLNETIAVLRRTPSVIRTLLEGLPHSWVTCDEGPDTFSPRDVVGHLIHGERTDWIPRAEIILAQGENRRFEPFDRFAHVRQMEGKTLDRLLDEFRELRNLNLVKLQSWRLAETEMKLKGEHPALGTVTLEQLLATWVVHDLTHLSQIARTMAKRYASDVGPWREYLSILNR